MGFGIVQDPSELADAAAQEAIWIAEGVEQPPGSSPIDLTPTVIDTTGGGGSGLPAPSFGPATDGVPQILPTLTATAAGIPTWVWLVGLGLVVWAASRSRGERSWD